MKDNAAIRINYVSELYQTGVENEKKEILMGLEEKFVRQHEDGTLHIHDLEAYGKVYNCCVPNMVSYLKSQNYCSVTQQGIMFEIFENIKSLIIKLATNQSGGIGFANFDLDVAEILEFLNINYCEKNIEALRDCIKGFIKWINITYTRYCREPYYLTLNIGLAVSDWGRKISALLLFLFESSPIEYNRPNIVFKVNKKINGRDTKNYEIYKMALLCTAKRMIPTYLLTDSVVNKKCDPNKLSIMGCRTRVYDNVNGIEGSIGRGNIACVSINLPRIALENSKVEDFYKRLDIVIDEAAAILLHRADKFEKNGNKYLKFVLEQALWETSDITQIKKKGTLSVGFIGLSECVEILTGNRPYQITNSFHLSIEIVKRIRDRIDDYRNNIGLNFSVLASPGELLSNKFSELDSRSYPHIVQKKGFYTNSFHVNVDAGISIYEKIDLEAPFHMLCNGGCITYIELSSAPLQNWEALDDGIMYAENMGISYLGFNFPYDICNVCGNLGTFDICNQCGSNDIKRIRRVSGYLEEMAYFTAGKLAEERNREANL